MKARNVMEDIVKKYLSEMWERRFDICTCDICRQDILAYVLSRLPARYVTTDSGAMHAIVDQIQVEESSLVLKEIVVAIKLVNERPRHEITQDREEAYRLLINQIKIDRGVDFSHYRDRVLKRRIALRMRARKVNSYAEYLQVLMHVPDEYEKLFEVLTINVSSFFRDQEVWDMLREKILPDIIANKKNETGYKKIRIWSAGCAHGEEPYSLAILLYELLEKENEKIKVEIVATDIDKESLKLANQAQYERYSLKNVNEQYLQRFFIPVKDKFQVVPHVKEMVKIKQGNLIHDPGIDGVDMVICRNVFIYFNRSLQEHLIMKYYDALVNRGYFVMGTSENLMGEAREVFDSVDAICRIFQKKQVVDS
ncbi:MAG: CheR family methyltransferase [Candidatus Omnitrophota bacterium]